MNTTIFLPSRRRLAPLSTAFWINLLIWSFTCELEKTSGNIMMEKKNHQKTSRMHEMKKQSRCKGMFSTYRKSYDAKNRNQLSTSVLFYHSDQNYSKILEVCFHLYANHWPNISTSICSHVHFKCLGKLHKFIFPGKSRTPMIWDISYWHQSSIFQKE